MKKHILFYLTIPLFFIIAGCSPKESVGVDAAGNEQMSKELEQLQNENEKLKEALKKRQEEIDFLLKRSKQNQIEQKELYALRNHLDLRTHQIVKAIKESDIESLKKWVSKDVTVEADKIVTNDRTQRIEYEFSFDTDEIIRQRSFSLQGTQYVSIYETIHPENDFTNSIEFTFVLEEDEWKLRTILTGA